MVGTSRIKSSGNIFKVIDMVESAILKEIMKNETSGLDKGSKFDWSEHLALVHSAKNYFKSYKWAHNDKEKMVLIYSNTKMKTAEIAEELGMNINSYRSMVSRVSARIGKLLFSTSDRVSNVILEADIKKAREMREHIDFLCNSFNIYKELSSEMMGLIEEKREPSENGDISDEDYFAALYFLTNFCKPIINARLEKLNPVALDYVMNQLSSNGYTTAMTHYNMLKEIMSTRALPKHIEEKCLNATGGKR